MSTTTTNLNMVLNEGQDKFSIPTLNENLTKIDTAIGEQNKNINNNVIIPVDSTNIDNYVSGNVSYIVKSGMCTVSFMALKLSTVGNNMINNLPKCAIYSSSFLAYETTPTVFAQILNNSNILILSANDANTAFFGSITYPVLND